MVAHIEVLVEEASTEAALLELLPKMLGDVTFRIHPHGGKSDLLRKVPSRLRAYSRWLPSDWRILVLVDQDQQDCGQLKRTLLHFVKAAGLRAASAKRPGGVVLARIAIEELEAWFVGDVPALVQAFPGVSPHLAAREKFRDPDAVTGGTWEVLARVLNAAGHYSEGYPKIEAARRVAEKMDPARNRSKSFQMFRDGLKAILQERGRS